MSFLGENRPQRGEKTARDGHSKPRGCDPARCWGPVDAPRAQDAAREPALAQTMIQPTGRIISEELLDTMRKTFPNKVFSAPPASLPEPRLLLASNLQALVTTTKVGVFVFPFPKLSIPGAQHTQDSIKAPGHVQLQPAASGLQTSGAGYTQNIQARLPKESLKQIPGSEHTRCRLLRITACYPRSSPSQTAARTESGPCDTTQ